MCSRQSSQTERKVEEHYRKCGSEGQYRFKKQIATYVPQPHRTSRSPEIDDRHRARTLYSAPGALRYQARPLLRLLKMSALNAIRMASGQVSVVT